MAVVGSHNAVDPERLFSKGKKADGAAGNCTMAGVRLHNAVDPEQ